MAKCGIHKVDESPAQIRECYARRDAYVGQHRAELDPWLVGLNYGAQDFGPVAPEGPMGKDAMGYDL